MAVALACSGGPGVLAIPDLQPLAYEPNHMGGKCKAHAIHMFTLARAIYQQQDCQVNQQLYFTCESTALVLFVSTPMASMQLAHAAHAAHAAHPHGAPTRPARPACLQAR